MSAGHEDARYLKRHHARGPSDVHFRSDWARVVTLRRLPLCPLAGKLPQIKRVVQDQMIIFMALADGESRLLCGPLTLHTETAIHIAEKMTGAKFKVGLSGKPEA